MKNYQPSPGEPMNEYMAVEKTKQQKPPHKLFNRLQYLLVALLALSVYFNTLGHGFVFDDNAFIVKNTFIQSRSILDIFSYEFLKHSWGDLDVNRPVMVASLILDFSIWKLNPMGYHLTNIILHAANTVAVLYLLKLIFLNSEVPIFVSMIFAVHPVHVQAVNAINFREDLLVTLFCLLSLIFFITGKNKTDFLFSLFFYFLALLSKETASVLPAICLLYQRVWKKEAPRWVFLGFGLELVSYLSFFLYAKHLSGGVSVFYEESLIERIYASLAVFFHYLRLHIFPIGLTADYDELAFIAFTFKNSFTSFTSLCLIASVAYTVVRKPSPKNFFLAWFFISLFPASNIVPILNYAAERYLYLPSVGLITLMFISVRDICTDKVKPFNALIIILIIFLSILTVKENLIWKDDRRLWSDTIAKAPGNANAHFQMGLLFAQKNLFDKAYSEYQSALTLAPNNAFFKSSVHNSLGLLYKKNGQYIKAYDEFQSSVKIDPKNYQAHFNLGLYYIKNLQYEKAATELEAALKLNPTDDRVHYYLGRAYERNKWHDKAYSAYQKSLELNPKNADAYFALGELFYDDSNISASIVMLRKGLSIAPDNVWARSFLANLYKGTDNEKRP